MMREMIARVFGHGIEIDRTNWQFDLPEDATQAMVGYHDTKMRHRVEAVEADEVFNKAREQMWAKCKVLGKTIASDLPDDHPIGVAWREASRARDAVRTRHNQESGRTHRRMTKSEREQYETLWVEWAYSDANGKDPVEHLSPSGRHKLVVTNHQTSPGCWGYTKGVVSRGDQAIAIVRRNYSRFPFAWMEDHVDGRDWLICGEDYQGQTFVQLDTGEVINNRSVGAEQGFGFCWADYRRLRDGCTLLVDGCFWGAPYELKFFDVSNPTKGWPEIELPGDLDYLDPAKSTVTVDDDVIVWEEHDHVYQPTGERESEIERKWGDLYSEISKAEAQEAGKAAVAAAQTAFDEHESTYPDDHEEEPDKWERIVDRRVKLAVKDGEYVVAEDWKSDWQLEQERDQDEWQEQGRAVRQQWVAEDELFQHLASQQDVSAGFLYPSRMARWTGDQNPAYLRVDVGHGCEAAHTATLQWGVVEGSVKVEMWVRGKGTVREESFPRDIEGIENAWASAQDHIGGA